MPLFRIFFILFIAVPLVEIYIFIQVGGLIGGISTVSLVVLTAIIGAVLLKYQGLQTLTRVQTKLQRGEIPAIDMVEGVILLFAAVLLLTPGFFTDIIGFICLLPAFRTYLATSFLKRLLQQRQKQDARYSVTINGEFWEDKQQNIYKEPKTLKGKR